MRSGVEDTREEKIKFICTGGWKNIKIPRFSFRGGAGSVRGGGGSRVFVSATCLCGAPCRRSSWEPRRTPRSPRLFNYTLHDDYRPTGAYNPIYRASFDKCGSASYRPAPVSYSEMYIAIKRTKNTCLFWSGGGELALIKSPQGDSPQSWHNGRVNDAT